MRRKCEGRVSARPSPCWMRCASPAQGAVPRAEGSGPPVARSHGLAQWQTRAQSAAAGRRQFVWRARPSRVCTPRLAERPRAHGTVVTEVLVPVVRVLVLEDHPLMAESVRALVARAQLALLPVVRTVAEAERVLAGLSKAERQSLAGVIDINLPDGSGRTSSVGGPRRGCAPSFSPPTSAREGWSKRWPRAPWPSLERPRRHRCCSMRCEPFPGASDSSAWRPSAPSRRERERPHSPPGRPRSFSSSGRAARTSRSLRRSGSHLAPWRAIASVC